jgi:hypothetical protein
VVIGGGYVENIRWFFLLSLLFPLFLHFVFPWYFLLSLLLFLSYFPCVFNSIFSLFFFVLSNPVVRSSKIFHPTSLFSSPSIYKQEDREPSLLCPIVVQGGSGVTLYLQGKVAARLQGMVPLSFIYQVGRVCGSMNCVGEGGAGENEFKNSFSPVACQREEEATQCRSKRHRVVFFFNSAWKRNEFENNPKIGYDNVNEIQANNKIHSENFHPKCSINTKNTRSIIIYSMIV